MIDWLDFLFGASIAAKICEVEYDDYYTSYYESDEYKEMIFEEKLIEKIKNNRPFLT